MNEEEYFPTEEPPKTPESTKPREGTLSKKTPTPKLNDGLPSSLLTPVTPTVSQGSVVKVLSPNKPQPNSPVSEADEVERKQTATSNHPNQSEKSDIKTKSVADSTSNVNGSESGEPTLKSTFLVSFANGICCMQPVSACLA